VKRTRNDAVLSLLLCMFAAALPALAKPPREISLSYHVTRGGMPVAVVVNDPRRVADDFDWPQARLTIKHQEREEIVKMRVVESDGARYEQTITRLEVRL